MDTFIVRVWTPAEPLGDDSPADELRGSIEHVPSHERSAFRSNEELLEILASALRRRDSYERERD